MWLASEDLSGRQHFRGFGWILMIVFLLSFLPQNAIAQVYCVRATGHTPHHERIFFQKGSFMAANKVIADVEPSLISPQTNHINKLFADIGRERMVGLYTSCIDELPLSDLRLQDPGGLLFDWDMKNLLNHTVAVPRTRWLHHASHAGGRYVFSLIDQARREYIIDLRSSSTAVVFFPDGTYRCLMDPNSQCASEPVKSDLVPGKAK